jgi:hypothetical protein
MSNKTLTERNPFREKSALSKIFEVLARSQKPLDVEEVAKRAKVPLGRTNRMLAAMANPFHNAGMRREGVQLVRKDGLLSLKTAVPDSKARRPERGVSKKQSGAKHRNGKSKRPLVQKVKPKAPAPKQDSKPTAAQNSVPEGAEAKTPSLNDREQLVLSTLRETPRSVDEIIAATKLKPEEALATLLVLEVRRLAKQHPGKTYSKSEAK